MNLRAPPPWTLALNEGLTARALSQMDAAIKNRKMEKECVVAFEHVLPSCHFNPSQLKAGLGWFVTASVQEVATCFGVTTLLPFFCTYPEIK